MPTIRGRRVGWGEVFVVLGLGCIVFALVSPTLSDRRQRERLEATATAVEGLRLTVEQQLERSGAWPAGPSAEGEAPPGLVAALHPADEVASYTLGWRPLEVVDSALVTIQVGTEDAAPGDAPPPVEATREMRPVVRVVGSITVTSTDSSLLAGLLARYGSDTSFVRDSTWTLILPRRAAGG